jgi:predicted PhzF superfamily epimerase YddE/YHI9
VTAYWICDAFAPAPFTGNPAAVVPLQGPAPADWMQAVAGEFNLSETAFCWPEEGAWRLRWFTPRVEVDLCGHATLASAAVLWHAGRSASAGITFRTRSGPLLAQRLDDAGRRIRLDFPATPCAAVRQPSEGLSDALGARVCWLGANAHDWLVELDDAETVHGLAPDHGRLAELPVRGIAVTARGGPAWGCDVVSRFFAPRVGIDEDPVTGSAHCALAPFWGPRLGKAVLRCRQLSPRGGELEAEVAGDRVLLSGAALVVAEGRLLAQRP